MMFRQIFYWLNMALKGKMNKTPAFNAYLFVCFLQFLNIVTLLIISTYLLKFYIPRDYDKPFLIVCFLNVPLFITNYTLLYSKRREIFTECEKQSKRSKMKWAIFTFLYVVISFLALYYSGINLPIPKN